MAAFTLAVKVAAKGAGRGAEGVGVKLWEVEDPPSMRLCVAAIHCSTATLIASISCSSVLSIEQLMHQGLKATSGSASQHQQMGGAKGVFLALGAMRKKEMVVAPSQGD
jgi:hypothetical protein